MGRPTVHPTGVTLYNPEKAASGYTLFAGPGVGSILIDMNGNVVRVWKNLGGFPPKMLPGGHLIGNSGSREAQFAYQDTLDLKMVDWDGNVEWVFNKNEQVVDDGEPYWCARQHHDFQVTGNPVGYYAPGQDPDPNFDKMLILTHRDVKKPKISPQNLLDDRLIEIDRDGNIMWEWSAVEHFNQFGFTEVQKNAMFRNPNTQNAGPEGQGDLFHINCASYLGPNKWFDGGDERFKPENIIMDSREMNMMWIIDHETGDVVWQVGPDFTDTPEKRIFGTIVGPHHTHMIPKGLPGEGHIMVYDNGGWAGYGAPNQFSKTGLKVTRRDGSRVIEFDPTTLEIVWECDGDNHFSAGGFNFNSNYFYSPLTSSAQRMPNGNTVICEGCSAIVREYTAEKELVWEFVYPHIGSALLYRAYRIPYEWIPQLEKPVETPIAQLDNDAFRVPGAADTNYADNAVEVEGVVLPKGNMAHCVESLD